jgi:hypothetical protein
MNAPFFSSLHDLQSVDVRFTQQAAASRPNARSAPVENSIVAAG